MYKSISKKNLASFVEKMWEAGVEICVKPKFNEISIYSGPKKYESIKVTTDAELEELVSYLTNEEDESVEL